MSTRPVIFISAVSKELHSARDLVAKTLIALGYEPRWQDIAATDTGDLRGVLRKWIDDSDAVLQLVGHCYGFAPMTLDRDFGACSYTQFEALYARQQGKPVYYIFTDDAHPTDGCGCEPQSLHDLQEQYRQQVKTHGDLYHNTSSLVQTELLVRRLKDDLAQLRKRGKQHAAVVLFLLVFCVLSVLWLLHGHQKDSKDLNDTKDAASKTEQKVDVLLQALRDLPQTLSQQPRTDAKEDEATRIARAYTVLETQLHLPHDSLAKELPQFAQQLLQRADTSALDRASAFYVTQKFAEAEAAALKAKDHALAAVGRPVQDALAALTLAGQSAEAQIHYAQAMDHYRAATALTSQERNILEWLDLQNAISGLYYLQGRYPEGLAHTKQVWQSARQAGQDEAPAVLAAHMRYANALRTNGKAGAAELEQRAVLKVQERVLGVEHPDTLKGRNNLAAALQAQGKYAEAEQEHRAVLQVMERVLGAEHPATLDSRMGVANTLYFQARYTEAEQEYRAVLKVQERLLGVEHPNTFGGRMNLATTLHSQARYAEAEQEYRAVLKGQKRVLGAEHPDTLMSRNNLAIALSLQARHAEAEQEFRAVNQVQERVLGAEHPTTLAGRNNLALALASQGKHAEAEQEYRAVLKVQERVLGAEHPDIATSCYNLALCIEAQQKQSEALAFMQRAEQVRTKVLGLEHPDTKAARERIEAALSKSKPASSPDAPATPERGAKSSEPPRDREMDKKLEMDVRGVLARQTMIYGPEHQATLFRRLDLAVVLDDAGKYAESEKEFRAVLKDQERVLGPEHHDVLETCFNFGHCLEHQNKLPEALALAQRVEQVHLKNLGPDHRDTKRARTERERIEAEMKK